MTHTFKNAELQRVFLRHQAKPKHIGESIEKAWDPTSKWSRAFIKKNRGLFSFAVLYVLIAVATLCFLLSGLLSGEDIATKAVFSAAVSGAFVEVIRRIYDTAVKRVAIIDLFTSEMFNILRTIAAANIIGQFALLYDIVDTGEPAGPAGAAGTPSAGAVAQPAGSENYFEIFQKNSADLSLLDPAAINDITAFYTFLKGSRDATGAFKLWNEPRRTAAMKKEDIVSVVYLCFLMTVHGMRALHRIVASQKNWKLIEDISAGVLLQCFEFLDYAVAKDDFRRLRIEQRRAKCAKLRQTYAYEFGPAKPSMSSNHPAS